MTISLTISHITKSYPTPEGELPILTDISLDISCGEAVAIVGPSGSGKSTLLNIIGSLDQPTSGTVRLGEVEITALAGKALAAFRAGKVGFIFQDHHLLPQLTALENVLMPALALGAVDGTEARAHALLERVGIAGRADAFPARMSGGERQRVAVARALINNPALLLCDEPTGNLDREAGASVVSLFLDLARENGVTVLMVTHNTAQAARFDRCLELRGGQLLAVEA